MIAYFDCFSGISGDMVLGSLIDAGADRSLLETVVTDLGLESEASLRIGHEQRGHLGGTRVEVQVRGERRRRVPDLREAVDRSRLPPWVRERSLAAIDRIAAAEARVHGTREADLHLHELGGADTLVDIVGAFTLLESMAAREVHCSPLPAPRGWIGDLPLPAPASLRILAGTGAVLVPSDVTRELVTPTGAAILASAAAFNRPAMRLDAVGYGIGGRPEPGNALAVWIGAVPPEAGQVAVIETNLDDMAPNALAALADDLMAAGALDVSVTAVVMKKGRAGHRLTLLAEPAAAGDLARRVLGRSTAFGLRIQLADRVLAGRRVVEVATPYGTVRVKVKELEGHDSEYAPEFDDCRRLSQATGADIRDVMRAAADSARGLARRP